MNTDTTHKDPLRFAIFRRQDAAGQHDIPIMSYEPLGPVAMAGGEKLLEAGIDRGHRSELLFSGGGFSLVYIWFKSQYPLPRHSHNVDCLYCIVGGSLRIGPEQLGVGDGFFVGADVPYTYVAGPDGVEVLEFRGSENFNIKVLAENEAFWNSALHIVEDNREKWLAEPQPSLGANRPRLEGLKAGD